MDPSDSPPLSALAETFSLSLVSTEGDRTRFSTKVCAKSIGTLCKILKNLKQFAFDGRYFANYGFLRLCREFSTRFCCKTGKISGSKISEKFWRFSKTNVLVQVFSMERFPKLSWVRICNWFHDQTPPDEEAAPPSYPSDCFGQFSQEVKFYVTFVTSSDPS